LFAAAAVSQQPSDQQPASQQPPIPVPAGPVIVLDPAHGGTDTGARGEGGVAERDIVLQMARTVRGELERQGYRVVMTRSDDSNPSYDDRAAVANAHREAIFISLHVSSTGGAGTVHTYFADLGSPIVAIPGSNAAPKAPAPQAVSLTEWEEAQRNYVDRSHRLADLVQIELAQQFAGSPAASTAAPVRVLRSVASPAIAIEMSSVSGLSQDVLLASATPIAGAIVRGVAASLQVSQSGVR